MLIIAPSPAAGKAHSRQSFAEWGGFFVHFGGYTSGALGMFHKHNPPPFLLWKLALAFFRQREYNHLS